MHESSFTLASVVLSLYGSHPGHRILEVGAGAPSGISLRRHVSEKVCYVGFDRQEGEGVDVVGEGNWLPFEREEFDLVVSTSVLEHDEFFWLTFLEMVRVLKVGGILYVNAPAKGPYHRHPVDCWRFYPDAGNALARWAKYRGEQVRLLEHFLSNAPGTDQPWTDNVMVFGKGTDAFVWPSLKDELVRRGMASDAKG